jgi:2-polyprenyl-3-methyl-5-hydroxy-6-metoxy-1,4-benzoquinol methylase
VINHLSPGHSFLDVGAGGCDIAVSLRSAGLDVSLADIQFEGLEYGRQLGFEKLYHFDLCRPMFCEHFSGVGAFDVIEHIEDDVTAVSSLLKMTKPGGYVFSTVPAFNQLWNNHDVMERHKRRYSMRQLQKLFLDQGAEIISCRYLFFSIFPLLVARALLSRLFPRTHFSKDDYKNRFEIPIWLNRSLLSLLTKETQWFLSNGPPFGGSLFICAKKPG